jgi:hypothetical protein
MLLQPKNWAVFQHYKDRCPPWIKLHRDLLNDRVFMCLPLASKALAPLLWLLASETKDGQFDGSMDELMFRLHITPKEYDDGLRPLIDKGFFVIASGVLADCKHVAIPETETEREEEAETLSVPPTRPAKIKEATRFDDFWQAWPTSKRKVGRAACEAKWKTQALDPLADRIIASVSRLRGTEQWLTGFEPSPMTYLNQKRWEDETPVSTNVADKVMFGRRYI